MKALFLYSKTLSCNDFVRDIQFMDDVFFRDILSFDGKIDKGSARKKATL